MVAIVATVAAAAIVFFLVWSARSAGGQGKFVEIVVTADPSLTVSELENAGVITHPAAFRVLLFVSSPFVTPVPGAHWLADDSTPAEVLRCLGRLSSRAHAKAVVPEGYTRFQIASRLDGLGVCSRAEFERAATDGAVVKASGLEADSAEGYLFPATYDFFADSDAASIVAEMVRRAQQGLSTLHSAYGARFEELRQKYGWTERDVLTIASIVEKEAARAEERPIIASVFYNRLDSADFRPARSLQSDPTASYGCQAIPSLPSCAGYAGRVTPAMLRGDDNPYNTYRHPGLPPGPISNPGTDSVVAVLSPAKTDYFFFVATGDGRHAFSRSLDEHDAAMRRPR